MIDIHMVWKMWSFQRIKQTQSIVNTKIVSNVSVLHKGPKTSKRYSYDNEKNLYREGFFFENRQTRLIIGSFLHVIFRGDNKKTKTCCYQTCLGVEQRQINVSFAYSNAKASEVAGSSNIKYKITSLLTS